MKKIIFIFLFFVISPLSGYANSLEINVNCKLISKYGNRSGDYNNVWIVNIDKQNNFFSIIDTYASATFSNRNGSLKFLGLYGGNYYLILKDSGYLYVYIPPIKNKNSSSIFGKGNMLNVFDPRGDAILYIAECRNLRK